VGLVRYVATSVLAVPHIQITYRRWILVCMKIGARFNLIHSSRSSARGKWNIQCRMFDLISKNGGWAKCLLKISHVRFCLQAQVLAFMQLWIPSSCLHSGQYALVESCEIPWVLCFYI
jgi:hypothetical protein